MIVIQHKDGAYEVSLTHRACGGKKKCFSFLPIISGIIGRKMQPQDGDCITERSNGRSMCRLRLVEEQRFSVACGVARETAVKSDESGDSYSHMTLKNGRMMLVLSDGMGTGKKAAEESRSAIELFENFTESGFDKDLAVKLINSALLLRNGQNESFSTLDVCAIDLRDGRAEFLKVGASSTFLLSGGSIETIRSASLPVGILESVEADTEKRRVKHGDIIVMMTDGVLDSYPNDEHKENWVIKCMKKFKGTNPQAIAEHLLLEAKKNYPGGPRDDMTVLVARIWEKI